MAAVVFDLDGTLIDSAGDIQSAANRMLADIPRPPLDRETIIRFVGRGVDFLVGRVLDHAGVAAGECELREHLAAFRRYYAASLTGQTRLYPGVEALLDLLFSRGITLGVCTNKPEGPARDICDDLGISPYIGAIVGGDTLPFKKPDPRPLLHVIGLLGSTEAETIYVGDSDTDYLTAKAAGVPFVFFERGYQRDMIPDFAPNHRVSHMFDVAAIVSG